MIRQHIYRSDSEGYRTVAASPGLIGSAWLTLLERETMLRCQSYAAAPLYYQFPLGTGLAVGRCGVDPNGKHGSYLAHTLVIDEAQDLNVLHGLHPTGQSLFVNAYAGQPGQISPLPVLQADALADENQLSDGFHLLDQWFDEIRLARVLTYLQMAAMDKRLNMHMVIAKDAQTVSQQGRLLMEMLMRALPQLMAQRVSYCAGQSPADTAVAYTAFVSARHSRDRERDIARGIACIDLSSGADYWPQGTPQLDETSISAARALLAHDILWVDRLRRGDGNVPLTPGKLKPLAVPPFEPGSDLKRYCMDWLEALRDSKSQLNDDAFATMAHECWPRFTAQVIHAGDVMEPWRYTSQLHSAIVTLCRGKLGEQLGMTDRDLTDLMVVLLDSISWDSVDLRDKKTLITVRKITGHVDLLGDKALNQATRLSCRVVHAMLSEDGMPVQQVLEDLNQLHEDETATFTQVQACAKRCVAGHCSAVKKGQNDGLADEIFLNASLVGYVRFEGGIPDFRALDSVRETIRVIQGDRQVRRFDAGLNRLRRGMHARTRDARRREMRLMLGISLLLALIILSVVLTYFLYIHK